MTKLAFAWASVNPASVNKAYSGSGPVLVKAAYKIIKSKRQECKRSDSLDYLLININAAVDHAT